MIDNELGPRMWVLLQMDEDTVANEVRVVSVYNDFELAHKVRRKLENLYGAHQSYWIENIPVDLDIWEDK